MNRIWSYFFPQQTTESEPAPPPKSDQETILDANVNTSSGKVKYGEAIEITREEVVGVPEAFLLHNVLSPDECQQFITIIEQIGAHKPAATVNGVISECKFWKAPMDVMIPIWKRVSSFFPEKLTDDGKNWGIVADNPMNEKFRFYCYDAGYVREKHFDGSFLRQNGTPKRDQSHYTFLIYLNEGFDGGETTFYPGGTNSLTSNEQTHQEIRVNPKMGTALVFRQTGESRPLHEGSVHRSADLRKCLMRSDVMYAET